MNLEQELTEKQKYEIQMCAWYFIELKRCPIKQQSDEPSDYKKKKFKEKMYF